MSSLNDSLKKLENHLKQKCGDDLKISIATDELLNLSELMNKGILTFEEFEEKRKKILMKIV